MSSKCSNSGLEFVANVKLVCIKKKQNAVTSACKPFHNTSIVVRASDALLLASQYTRGIYKRDEVENISLTALSAGTCLSTLEFIEKCSTKPLERSKRPVRLNGKGISRNYAVACGRIIGSRNNSKPISCGLWSNSLAGKVAAYQEADERCFTHGVLADQQNHRFRIEVSIRHDWRVELSELELHFERLNACAVQALEAFNSGVTVVHISTRGTRLTACYLGIAAFTDTLW
mmetsp:Transcript_5369/g.11085  ORF Transcript_5369/g.11085 Transcript_5369/m.11085 type:complete len:231 (-) Transcript_5369:842-1534(-)